MPGGDTPAGQDPLEPVEYLDVVDAEDRVIGRAPRTTIHRDHLIHRGVHVLVVDEHGDILLQRRAGTVDTHPGWWDASAGGHVHSGESYRAAAERELLEELGCRHTRLEYLLTYDGYSVRQFEKRALFLHRCSGPFCPDPATVAAVQFCAPARLVELFASQACTEGLMRSVSHYFAGLAAAGRDSPSWRWQPGPEPRPVPG
jgi:16S rRNA (adenine1518-N6/adenine1519-N6)-dimethyltransferase